MQIINIFNFGGGYEGTICPLRNVDYIEFNNIIRKSFIDFHKSKSFDCDEYILNDFVNFHNENNNIKIYEIIGNNVQLNRSETI